MARSNTTTPPAQELAVKEMKELVENSYTEDEIFAMRRACPPPAPAMRPFTRIIAAAAAAAAAALCSITSHTRSLATSTGCLLSHCTAALIFILVFVTHVHTTDIPCLQASSLLYALSTDTLQCAVALFDTGEGKVARADVWRILQVRGQARS
jgi:hypothetical protein